MSTAVPPRPYAPAPTEQLGGVVERVTFHSEETSFCVLRVQVRGMRDLATVVGTAPEVRAGESVEAQGSWAVDPVHGQQFRAHTLKTVQPHTAEGMARYLASGLIKGIGPAFARRLVDAFGTAVFDVIEQTPERLLEVGGIGKGRQAKIVSAWNDQRAVREIMVFLHSHGVGTARDFRIYKQYGEEAIDTEEQEVLVRFEGRGVVYSFDELDELVLSYATTVHKSQGSEYPAVVVPVHTQHWTLLQRNLLYTAMTRGRKLVVLVGTKKAVAIAFKRLDATRRVTTLAERLREAAYGVGGDRRAGDRPVHPGRRPHGLMP